MAQVFKGLNAWRPKNLKWRHAQKPQNPKILKPESPKVQKPKNKPNCPKRVSKNSFIWYIHSYCISRLHQLGNPKALPEYSSMWSGCAFKKWLLLVLSSTSFNLMYAEYQNGTVLEIQQYILVVLVLLQRIELTFLLNSIPWLWSIRLSFRFFLTYILTFSVEK